MAKQPNDFWFLQRYHNNSQLRKDILNLEKRYKYIFSFPNFLLPLAYDEFFDRTKNFDSYLISLDQDFEIIRKHKLTQIEKLAIEKDRTFMDGCQNNVLSAFQYASQKMVGKNGKWQAFYRENFSWFIQEDLGGFFWNAARQGFSFDTKTTKELIDKELRPGVDITKTGFYKELMKINDTMILNSAISVNYFKNKNHGLLSRSDQLSPILGALAVDDPFKEDPNLRKECLNLYREMKVNTVNDNHHHSIVNICRRIKTNEARRDDSTSGRSIISNKGGW